MEQPLPTISVVMTVFNTEKFLEKAVRSILGQTLSELEFIIVDDGSTDTSRDIVRKFSDRRIRFFPLDHVGRAAALNYAVAQTRAPLLAFADSDDIASPQRLDLQYQALRNDPAVGAVSSWYQIIDEHDDPIREKRLPTSHDAIAAMMPVQCSMCFPAALVRKEMIELAGPFDERLTAAVDYDFWLRMLDKTRLVNLPMTLIRFRRSSHSISSRLKEVQEQRAYEMGKNYLIKKYEGVRDGDEREVISLQIGKLEYYAGNMAASRKHLAGLLWNNRNMFIAWRYFLASLAGKRAFAFLRRTGIAARVGSLLGASSSKNEYFMP